MHSLFFLQILLPLREIEGEHYFLKRTVLVHNNKRNKPTFSCNPALQEMTLCFPLLFCPRPSAMTWLFGPHITLIIEQTLSPLRNPHESILETRVKKLYWQLIEEPKANVLVLCFTWNILEATSKQKGQYDEHHSYKSMSQTHPGSL